MKKNIIKDLVITVGLFVLALYLFSLSWKFSLSNPDNLNLNFGVSTVGAERVLRGEIPYRDFWTMYAPGHFYLLAEIFSVFGKHLMVEVIAATIITSASVSACYWVVRSFSSARLLAIASAVIFFGAMYDTSYFQRVGSYPTAIFLVFMTLIFSIQFLKSSKTIYLIIAGLFSGVSIVFKHDVGLYTMVAITAGLFLFQLLNRVKEKIDYGSLIRQLVYFYSSAAVVAVPIAVYFLVATGGNIIQNLVIFPLTDFRYARPENYPGFIPDGLISKSGEEIFNYLAGYFKFNLPLFLTGLGSIGIWFAIRKKERFLAACGTMFVSGFVIHFYAAHVQINTHIISMAIYGSWIGILLYELLIKNYSLSRSIFAYGAILIVATIWISSMLYRPVNRHLRDLRTYRGDFMLEKVSGFRATKRQAEKFGMLKEYIDTNVPEDEPIFVGLNRHDVIVTNDIMIYYLLDRPIATRYHELHPAIADTAEVQQEIIRELNDKKVRFVILKRIFSQSKLDRMKVDFQKHLPNIGALDLDTFISQNYETVQTIGPYNIWVLKKSTRSVGDQTG